MGKQVSTLTAAQKRHMAYKALATEGDKDARNKAITDALGETDKHNVETSGRKHVFRDRETGERIVLSEPIELKRAALPTAPASKSAKRARLKASRSRKVRTVRHAHGRCSNVGCVRCSPVAAKAKAALTARRLFEAS
jgi:hypothetical protein